MKSLNSACGGSNCASSRAHLYRDMTKIYRVSAINIKYRDISYIAATLAGGLDFEVL